MTLSRLDEWLDALGYEPASPSIHRASATLTQRHPYAPELHDLLSPQGEICASAVFDVEGMPTVTFFHDDGSVLGDAERLTRLRERIWNQGLVTVLMFVGKDTLTALPVTPGNDGPKVLAWAQARRDGPFSKADLQSGDVRDRCPEWFEPGNRVDRKLLANLQLTINSLVRLPDRPLRIEQAQYLVGQVLFVSYLEHRGIVSARYRETHAVSSLHDLVVNRDRAGLVRLFDQLKRDFNGDFLDRPDGTPSLWEELSDDGYLSITDLLMATDIERRQPSMFAYNFRYIPVELLSGIYESFLGAEAKEELAAYYTPRHLANLVVDQALSGSPDLLAEKIYDGACGSGILLTTAFRRLLGEAEARQGETLALRERIALLRGHIFGSDLSEAACRVTAFSLYLSLLERLQPADIVALCEDAQVKLPTLQGENLFSGDDAGDFFSPHNPLTARRDMTLYLSNPPWMELTGEKQSRWVSTWAEGAGAKRVLKQVAADFMRQVAEIAPVGARVCFILPMTLWLKPTSQGFIADWLFRMRPRRLINFGDLKELLFDDGRGACVVVLADRRIEPRVPVEETFEYWVPKADIGLAFGRLTLHGVDRHQVQTQAILRDVRELVTRMWGDGFDLALWARLRLRGTFGDMVGTPKARKRWVRRKGFHKTDNSKGAIRRDSACFHRLPFVRPEQLYDTPVVQGSHPFPRDEIPEFSGDPDDLMPLFEGPRILFPDGPAPNGTVRAAFIDTPACFMSSIGVISGPEVDADLLRFAAVYLRSDLVRYFTMTQLYQLLGDRDRVSLRDIAAFPFYPPERHADPDMARALVAEVARLHREIESAHELERKLTWEQRRPEMDALVFQYFGLGEGAEGQVVRETVDVVHDMVRPYGLSKVYTLARRRVHDVQAKAYASHLQSELRAWRDARGGVGDFAVDVRLTNLERAGAFGIVSVRLGGSGKVSSTRDDSAVDAVVVALRDHRLLPVKLRDTVYLAADTVIVTDDTVHFIKPQAQRLWLLRQAQRDAERLVRATLRAAPAVDIESEPV